ncbi:MAG: SGNH/GDSL hydrolase family protein, partial [Victivallales bacterium]|nr:SGNH/GDSL hydrolase family protein [Victivallales bacterium]
MADFYKDLKEIDPRMAARPADSDGIAWHLPFEPPMRLCGFAWFDRDRKYVRLPLDRPSEVTQFPEGVRTMVPAGNCGAFTLAVHTAGGQVRFRTDSGKFQLRGELLATGGMDHMAFTGSSGFDIYLQFGGVWRCLGVTRTDHSRLEFSASVVSGVKREMHEVLINMPLYNGVTSLFIGLDDDAKLEEPAPFADSRPIVWYGTSIQHGGCACRPGMVSSNIVSRMLNREVINLGFSGSGKGEPEVAEMLAEIRNPSIYLVDYTWNVDPKALEATLPRFLDILRRAHPTVPIMLFSPTPGKDYFPEMHPDALDAKAKTMRDEAARRRAH